MPLDETFTNLAAFLNSLDAEGEQKFELSHSLVIICPDCGKNIAFRGRCPKCAGNSWIPAGHAAGIFERTKAQRLRRMIADDDMTVRGRGDASALVNNTTTATGVVDAPAIVTGAPPLDVAGDETVLDRDATTVDDANGGGTKQRRRRNH
ncbi:MAG: hypothetical protein M3Q69_07680 [Acidobacteriota bacterium]|nr:hypothetical protein [Acidobacteriota bacterium]